MSYDWQMAKSKDDSKYDLAIGEPVVLQQAMRRHHMYKGLGGKFSPAYPCMEGDQELLDELRDLYPQGEIVIANGAKQALLASMYALKKYLNLKMVYCEPPYWPSYPTLAAHSGLEFTTIRNASAIGCNTTPNNPDGRHSDYGMVWDAVYAHPMYGYFPHETPGHIVSIHSAAKLLGMSSARVGWAVCAIPEIAQLMRQYVESTTSGVSTITQKMTARVLKNMRENPDLVDEVHAEVKRDIKQNRQVIVNALYPWFSDINYPAAGMFTWIRFSEADWFKGHLSKASVRAVSGEACGAKGPGWYRISNAQDCQITEEAMLALSAQLFSDTPDDWDEYGGR